MRKYFVAGLLCFLFTYVKGQDKGVFFEQAENWDQIAAKAKATNKYIFVDCYTTWCLPCKEISKKIFPLSSIGNYMNQHFVNVQVQMDTTANDATQIKNFYKIAHSFSVTYHITAYPTFLVFSPDGKILDKNIGAFPDSTTFLEKIAESLDPYHQFYALQNLYKQTRDVTLIPKLVTSALEAGESTEAISGDFIKSVKNPYTKANLEIIRQITKKTSDKGYDLFLHQTKRVNDTLGARVAEILVMWVLWNEEVAPFFKDKNDSLDWDKLEARLRKKSNSSLATEVTFKAKWNYFASKKRWTDFANSLLFYLNHYSEDVQPFFINKLIWQVFMHIGDEKLLEAFLPLAKKSFEYDSTFTAGIDTYANLLYKLGRIGDAIQWEEKAIAIAENSKNKKEADLLIQTIGKMKANIKTWE